MNGRSLTIGALILFGVPSVATAQALTKCSAGQAVIDKEGKTGVIVADDAKLCQVKYGNGQIYSWIFWNLRPAGGAAAVRPPDAIAPAAPSAPSSGSPGMPTVLKPASNRTLVYRADRRGHFTVTAAVNGAPVRLVVDTGASLVALTVEDARAAGFDRAGLMFNGLTKTANGPTRFAPVTLSQIRIEQLVVDNVPAAVIENLDQSLLGMSFLKRLKSFEMREGALTISW